jgi:hypothetical protein
MASRVVYHPDITKTDYDFVKKIQGTFSWYIAILVLGTVGEISHIYRNNSFRMKMRANMILAFNVLSLLIPFGFYTHA